MKTLVIFPCALTLFLATASVALASDKDLLEYGDTITGTLSVAGEVDVHTFVGQAGDVVVVRLAEFTSILEPEITLSGPPGDDYFDSHTSMAEILTDPLSQDFTYTIQVSDGGDNDTGNYSLHIQRINNPVGASTLDFGTTVPGSYIQGAQTVAYTLDAAAGDRVLFRFAKDPGSPTIYTKIRIYRPDGTLLVSSTRGQTGELNTVEMPVTGTYTVLAMDHYGTYTGDYWLHCQRTNGPVGATSISYDQTLGGDWAHPAETDAFTFDGTDSDLLLARLVETVSATEPLLRLYDSDGVQITGDAHTYLAELPLTDLPGTGTYTLLAMDDPGWDTGGYWLHIQRTDNPVGASPLAFGPTVAGSLPQKAQTTAYSFAANAGDRVIFRVAMDAGSATIYIRMRIYRPDGTLLTSSTAGPASELNTVEIPAPGTYALLTMDGTGQHTGDYWLHCQRTNDPVGAVVLDYGDTHDDIWALRAETDAYTFTGGANDTLEVRLTELGSYTEPLLRLYDPDGVQLDGDADSDEAVITGLHLPVAGVYTLLTMDEPGTDTGSYRLSLVGGSSVNAVPDGDLPPVRTVLYECQPNPFNPATRIRFDLVHSTAVCLDIFSLDGRRLTTLVDGTMPRGRHTIAWEGLDESGRQVATGTYLIRLLVDGEQMVTRATLLK